MPQPFMEPIKQGKVREIYDLGEHYLFVASDRISAFDSVLKSEIPDKGRVLNMISAFWFEKTRDIVKNHVVETDFDRFPEKLKKFEFLKGRSMIVRKAEIFPVECIVRGYLVGSGYKEYVKTGQVCGNALPEGLKIASRLETPLFTPSTKAESGHDENISFSEMVKIIGKDATDKLADASLKLYRYAADYALDRGIIIADTKFEFGVIDGEICVVDEILTPDSSRFWPADRYKEGENPPSFDKQYVRDWLEESGWNKQPPAPALPGEVIARTRGKYLEAYERLTGNKIE
ncbi:MAG: phosphoribosylaminoimidazolesuccinocarboxamide synthase [Acidobacteria bacterium]|nr:phosphoribosylaminoimidazolesuccinocarboxamide synthase [Acidobacteriota bacterium]